MSNIKPTSDKQTKENDKTKAIKKKNFLEGKKCLKHLMLFFEDEE